MSGEDGTDDMFDVVVMTSDGRWLNYEAGNQMVAVQMVEKLIADPENIRIEIARLRESDE